MNASFQTSTCVELASLVRKGNAKADIKLDEGERGKAGRKERFKVRRGGRIREAGKERGREKKREK